MQTEMSEDPQELLGLTHKKVYKQQFFFFLNISRQGSELFWSCLRTVYVGFAKIPVDSGWICLGFLKIYFIISCLTPTCVLSTVWGLYS